MAYLYKCDTWKDINGEAVPDVEGLRKWRVLARHPIMSIIESDVELPLELAPEKWPNGVPVVDKGCLAEWHDGVPEEVDPLAEYSDAEIEKSVRIRALNLTGHMPLKGK